MPLAVSDIVRVTVGGEKDGQSILNIFDFQVTTAPSTGTPGENIEALLQHLWNSTTGTWHDTWLACLPDDYLLRLVRGQRIAPTRSAYVENLIVSPGTIAADQMQTANLTWVFIKQTELAGRRGRGTTHMLLPATTWMLNGNLDTNGAAERDLLVNLVDDQVTVAAGGVYVPVIFHPNFSPNFSRITHATEKTEIRTMRRRTVGRGI